MSLQFPTDERARAFLDSSPPDVQATVVREFKPKGQGEGDYSDAVFAYAKICHQYLGHPTPEPLSERPHQLQIFPTEAQMY